MIILSEMTTDLRFKKIEKASDCDNIESNFCVYFEVNLESDLNFNLWIEKYFILAKELQKNDVEYAAVVDISSHVYRDSFRFYKTLLLMFANFGAKYFIVKNFSNVTNILISLQKVTNYYLLDTKIMLLSQNLYSDVERFSQVYDGYTDMIGVDGAIESSLLEP